MGWIPPAPEMPRAAATSCEGCGAPLERHALRCSYCRRAAPEGGSAPAILTTRGALSDAECQRLRVLWEQHYTSPGAGRVIVLDASTIDGPRFVTGRAPA